MSCFAPLRGWWSRERTPLGKRRVVFSGSEGYADLPVDVPCGQCIGCRQEQKRQMAIRCMHEASLHDENCFLTLTYDDAHLPEYGSLRKADFQKFMKRLRKFFAPRRVRFLHSGEYGDDKLRPHYHALLFGVDFPDKYKWSTRGRFPVYRSPTLETLWKGGQSEIGTVTYASAAYVAKYCVKKLTGVEGHEQYKALDHRTGELVPVEAEYATMSRRPGIGAEWYRKYGEEVYRDGTVVIDGVEVRAPRYYDKLAEEDRPAQLRRVKRKRMESVNEDEQAPNRLTVREYVAWRRLELYSKEAV